MRRAGIRFPPSLVLGLAGILAGGAPASASAPSAAAPSFVLVLSDDQGWGDAGYSGHAVLRTPHLDAMARQGVRFDRFYAGGPLCAPTRGSVLTGRHPLRYGVKHSLHAVLPAEELTIAEILRECGYATGHFGKWHLGALTRDNPDWAYSPPWEHGFDVCFSSESSLPTWDPLVDPATGRPSGDRYWTGPEQPATGDLRGDASRVIMDRAVEFVRGAVEQGVPFLAVIWLHAPHYPAVAGPADRDTYAGASADAVAYYGSLTAMDREIGRLRRVLETIGVQDDTAVFFASDNGPDLRSREGWANPVGSAGFLRGEKSELLEGGVRVPALLSWPARVGGPRVVSTPWSTLDYLPTLADAAGCGADWPGPLDGVSLLPLLDRAEEVRPQPIGFRARLQSALVDGSYKLLTQNEGRTWELYDVDRDPGEETDLSERMPERLDGMKRTLLRERGEWMSSGR